MALDFPDSPTDGDLYEGFVWDDTVGVWRVRGLINNWAGITPSGTYYTDTDSSATIYTFYDPTSTDSITVDVAGKAHILVVGGGGGGGRGWSGAATGGGGGAGGVIELTEAYLEAGTHSIVVGDGGNGNTSTTRSPQSSSRLGPYFAFAGGIGSFYDTAYSHTGMYGGSGGGARDSSSTLYGEGVPGQGNDGGAGGTRNGGGGAGQAGNTNGNGYGGDGVTVSVINSTIATSRSVGEVSGSGVYFGGGGSAGAVNGGGLGGGGDQHTAGSANTGGGGGGGDSSNALAGAGGSGIVIVRIG